MPSSATESPSPIFSINAICATPFAPSGSCPRAAADRAAGFTLDHDLTRSRRFALRARASTSSTDRPESDGLPT